MMMMMRKNNSDDNVSYDKIDFEDVPLRK